MLFPEEKVFGKSTLALLLGQAIDKNFDLEKNVLYSPSTEEMKDKMVNAPRYAAIIADESIKILFKQAWQKAKFLTVLFNVIRQENKCCMLVLPRFMDLTEYFRNHRVYLHINILSRGRAVVFAYDSSIGSKDPWRLDENYKNIRRKLNNKLPAFVNPDVYEAALMSCSNFLMMLDFPKMPNTMHEKYKFLKDKYKLDDMGENNIKETATDKKYRRALMKSLLWLEREGFAMLDMAKELKISNSVLSALLRKFKKEMEEKPNEFNTKLPRRLKKGQTIEGIVAAEETLNGKFLDLATNSLSKLDEALGK